MRSLLSSALVAVGATLALFLVLTFTLPDNAWFRAFLFERSFVQWLSIAMFIFGADILIRKTRRLSREQADLSGAQWQDYPDAAGTWVRRRIAAVAKMAASHSPSFCRDAARDLSDEDNQALNESYVLPSDVIGLLPLAGFFGTVLGLSGGLYNNFVLQGEDSTDSFANAIGTAFDTTLLALALTIALSIAQSLLRRSEQSLLVKLDRFVEDQLLGLDATGTSPVPASNDPRVWLDELGIDPAELIGYFRAKLGGIAADLSALGATNEKLTAAIAGLDATTAKLAAQSAEPPPAPPDLSPQLAALVAASEQAATAAREQLVKLAALEAQATTLAAQSEAAQTADAAAREKQLAALAEIAAGLESARQQAATAQTSLRETITTGQTGLRDAITTTHGDLRDALLAATRDLRDTTESGHDELGKIVATAAEDVAAQLKLAATAQQDALAALQEQADAAHRHTHDLLNRPKSFTVTERPAAPSPHDPKA